MYIDVSRKVKKQKTLKPILSIVVVIICCSYLWGQNTITPFFSSVNPDSIEQYLRFESDSIIENLILLSNNQFLFRREKNGCYLCTIEGHGNYYIKEDTLFLVDTTYRNVVEVTFNKVKKKYYGFKLSGDQEIINIGIEINGEIYKADTNGIISIPEGQIKFINGTCNLSLIDTDSGRIFWVISLDKEEYGIREYQIQMDKKANYYRYVWDNDKLIELDSRDQFSESINRTFIVKNFEK